MIQTYGVLQRTCINASDTNTNNDAELYKEYAQTDSTDNAGDKQYNKPELYFSTSTIVITASEQQSESRLIVKNPNAHTPSNENIPTELKQQNTLYIIC